MFCTIKLVMYMIIPVGVSRRHVHLTEEVAKELFGTSELPVRNPLNQPGQFASTFTVDLEWNGQVIEHVRVVGPIRPYNQIELSDDECSIIGVNPPERQSGDLEGSLPINIIGPNGKVSLSSGLIKAERHIHMTPESCEKENVVNKEPVEVYHNGKFVFKAIIKLSDPGFDEIHIDTVEEKTYDLHTGDLVEFKKCGK